MHPKLSETHDLLHPFFHKFREHRGRRSSFEVIVIVVQYKLM